MFLDIKNLNVSYGNSKAIFDVSLNIEEGEIVCIVGANGAGKTTIINTISGLVKPNSGDIWFKGKNIRGLRAHNIANMGIRQIPAGRMIFSSMTVLDNLKMGALLRKDNQRVKEDLNNMYEYFPILKEKQSQLGGELSGGQQQMLAIARALMARPELILMDEPSMGLSPILVAEVREIINSIHRNGISILLVEQNCRMALQISERAYVLERGKISLQGDALELADNETVKKCYLGG